jgi:peptidoglycan/LPS O-acetylase OafA/YrhL
VEEQFYIFWPWVIKRQKKLVNSLLIILFLFMVLKAIAWMILIKGGVDWPYKLILLNRFDCLVIGALGAVLYMRRAQWFMKLNFNFFIQCLPLIGIVLMAINRFHFIVTIDHDIAAVLTVILIVNVIANEKVILELNQAPFDFLGKISYGIYIYHPLVIFLAYRILGNYHVGNGGTNTYMILFAMVLCGTILVAWASYVFFEKRFLLMREKYAVIPSKM